MWSWAPRRMHRRPRLILHRFIRHLLCAAWRQKQTACSWQGSSGLSRSAFLERRAVNKLSSLMGFPLILQTQGRGDPKAS